MRQKSGKLDYFLSQPHQPFFFWGVVNAILFMTLFLLSYKGVVVLDMTPNLFHAYSLIFIVFTAFFQGFLLTTFTRFSQMPPLDPKIYTTNFTILAAGTLLFLIGAFSSKIVTAVGMLLLLGNQIFTFYAFWKVYKASPSPDKYDQFWILTAWASGIAANLLLIAAYLGGWLGLEEFAKEAAVYLYLVFVALSVGQRMIPFFSHVMIDKNRNLLKVTYLLFLAAIMIDAVAGGFGFVALFAASLLLAKEIYRWRLPFRQSEPILWILHLAIFWLPLGLFLGAAAEFIRIFSGQELIFLSLHLVTLGFVTTVLIGFGTRVTLGHSGNMMVTDNRTKMLFYMTQAVIYMRALYSFTGTSFLFDLTIALWLILFGGWAVKYFPALLFGKRIT
jgi:uncharacterized protein involved in response to NO